jgi:lysophospholipase L1-like esterase
MARSRQGKAAYGAARGLAFALIGLVLAVAPRAAAQTMPPPVSRECNAPDQSSNTEPPLPNVAMALQGKKRIKILAIGASASAGPGAARGGYQAVIRRMLLQNFKGVDVEIVNRGVSGELAERAAERLKLEVGLNAPDLVLWQVGTNDALSYIPVADVEAVVTSTVRWLKEHKVDVVLVGLQFVAEMARDAHYQAICMSLRRVAQRENIIIVRRYEAMETLRRLQSPEPGTSFDEFAYNEAQLSCMAQYVARSITVALFGRNLRPPPPAPAPQRSNRPNWMRMPGAPPR